MDDQLPSQSDNEKGDNEGENNAGLNTPEEKKKGHKKNRSDNYAKLSARIIEKWGNISPKKKQKQKHKEDFGGGDSVGLLQASVVPDLVKGEVSGCSLSFQYTFDMRRALHYNDT
jgi:hypothetical protein